MAKIKTALLFAAAGAAAQYFLDSDRGRTRRAKTSDQLTAALRRPARKAEDQFAKKTQYAHDKAQGVAHELTPRPAPANDQELADRVRSEVLGDAEYHGPTFNVDAVDGVVSLRGEAETPEQIKHLEAAVAKVPGVVRVDSLLHLPGTPAPNKADALGATEGR